MNQAETNEALDNLRVVRDTIDQSKKFHYWQDFVAESRKLFLFGGIAIVIATLLSAGIRAVAFPSWTHWIVWVTVLLALALYKTALFRQLGKKNGLSFISYVKKITPKEFWQIDIPLEITGVAAIVLCSLSGNYQYILPLIVLDAGHIFNALGVLFKTKSFVQLGYVWQAIGIGLLFYPVVDSLLIVGISFGVLLILYSALTGGNHGSRE